MRARSLSTASLLAASAAIAACATQPPAPGRAPASLSTASAEAATEEPAPAGFRWRDGAAQLRARSVALASLTPDPADRGEALVVVLRALDPVDPSVPGLLARLAAATSQPPPARLERHEVDARASRELFLAGRLLDRGERPRAIAIVERIAAAPPARSERRAELARLLVRLDQRERALTFATPVEEPATDAEEDPGEEAADEGVDEEPGEAGNDEDDDVLTAIASEEAARGDVAWVTRELMPRLSASGACAALAALGARHWREGRGVEAERAWASIRPHLAEHGEPEGAAATVACLAAEARARLAHADRDGAATALASLGLEDDEAACGLLIELRREVDPTLLDVPVEVAARASRHVRRFAWEGCPTALAEALVRRGEPRRAMGLVARWRGSGVRGAIDFTDGPEWPVLLRLGHLAPHQVVGLPPGGRGATGGIETELELARVLDEAPDRPLDRGSFDASFPPVELALPR